MRHFFLNIFRRYSQWIFSTWMILLLLDFLLSRFAGQQVSALTSIIGFMLCAFVGTISMNSTRWVVYWRRTASSIKEFWLGIFAVQIFSLGLNGAIFFIISRFYGAEEVEGGLFQLTPFDLTWALILAISFSVAVMNDTKAMLANNSLRPSRQIFMLLGIYIWMLVVCPLFLYSHMLGYLVIEISILFWFLIGNTFVLGSIRKAVSRKILAVGIIGSLALSIISYAVALKGLPGSERFLGGLGPHKKAQFSELSSIDTPSLWIRWRNQVGTLDTEQTIIALSKLEDICPPQPTDTPTVIQCFEKKPTEEGASLDDSFNSVDASKAIRLLRDAHVYTKLVGLINARGLDELSPDIKEAISALTISGGRLAPVAELTLASHKKGQKRRIRIVIESKK